MIKKCFSKKQNRHPPGNLFLHNFFLFLNVGNSIKREENIKY